MPVVAYVNSLHITTTSDLCAHRANLVVRSVDTGVKLFNTVETLAGNGAAGFVALINGNVLHVLNGLSLCKLDSACEVLVGLANGRVGALDQIITALGSGHGRCLSPWLLELVTL